MRTELANRPVGSGTNALASSIVLVCRKRTVGAPMCTRRDFINTLKREMKPTLEKLQASNIAPVDLAQSAIGPGMGVYSQFAKVLEADGTPMSVRSAQQIINQEMDLYFNEQDGELDKESRFCVELYNQCAFNEIKYGEADVLARAKNTSVERLRTDGVMFAEKGVARLLTREELPQTVDRSKCIWLMTQLLTHAMETDGVNGVTKIVSSIFTSEPERVKVLAYRLFTLAERRGWTCEAFAYNSHIVAWPDVQSRAAELSAAWDSAEKTEITIPPLKVGVRNNLAHLGGNDFSDDDTWRALDTMFRVCDQLDPEGAEEIRKLLRTFRYGRESGSTSLTAPAATPARAKKKSGILDSTPVRGLPCWRDVIQPHPDVAQGRDKNAEFVADLSQVARDESTYEYRDPVEFFARTYVTEGMIGLLEQALRRVSGKDGEPVIRF